MARISGIDLPRDKRVEIGLTYIYGIGRKKATEIINATGVNPDTRVKDLTESEISKLREYIDKNVKVEGDLRREVSLNIKRLVEMGCYRGVRHRRGSACQRTEHQAERPDQERSQTYCRCAQKEIRRFMNGKANSTQNTETP